jgi:hypothetical protein
MISVNQYIAIETYCKRIVKRAKANLRRKNKLASGVLYDSITYRINKRSSAFQFEYAAHGEFVEKGRRRGAKMPPIEPIAKWIKQRGLDLSPWAVAKSIQKKGIKKYPFISNEIDKSQEELHDLLFEAYQKDIDSI